MKTYCSVIVLLYVAVLVTTAEPQCQCDETSTISLSFNKNVDLSQGHCGQLKLNNCILNIICHANSTITSAWFDGLEIDCSHNSTDVKRTSADSDNRTISINLACSDDGEAHLEEESSEVFALKIPKVCSSLSNATNNTTTHTEKPHTTEEVKTTANNDNVTTTANNDNVTTTAWTPNNSNLTSENPLYSETTQFWNSSSDTTNRVPSRNSTEEYSSTTSGHVDSLRVCSGLMLMILAVSSVL